MSNGFSPKRDVYSHERVRDDTVDCDAVHDVGTKKPNRSYFNRGSHTGKFGNFVAKVVIICLPGGGAKLKSRLLYTGGRNGDMTFFFLIL